MLTKFSGMYASYILPIMYMALYGRSMLSKDDFGPFTMGKWGLGVNIFAICWLTIAMVFSTFPSMQPVTPQNMNYAIAVMGGWLVVGASFYFVVGNKSYAGPML
jgi:choline transport protein